MGITGVDALRDSRAKMDRIIKILFPKALKISW